MTKEEALILLSEHFSEGLVRTILDAISKDEPKKWVGLTDEDDIDWEEGGNLKDLVKAIEAKLKEKNGY
jgi:hypothetical protein